MEHQNATDADDATETEQTTLLTFETVTVEDTETGETREGVQVEVHDDGGEADHRREIEQYESLKGASPLHEKIMMMAEELDVDTRVVELPRIMSVQTDKHGDKFVSDTNEVVRYYLEDQTLVTTGDYEDKELIADGTQRKNDLRQMYETA